MPRTISKQAVRKPDGDCTGTKRKSKVDPTQFISTGSTLLNLSLTGHPFCGFQLGKLTNLIGDSSSGKTAVAMAVLAEAHQRKRFKDYTLDYADVEAALEFDIEHLYGESFYRRMFKVDGEWNGDTIEEWSKYIFKLIAKGDPFIHILDSLDALPAAVEMDRLTNTDERGQQKGSYKMEKPKIIGEILRNIVRELKRTQSAVIIISQTRDNIDPFSFEKKSRSGGNALKFYSTHELWMAVKKSLKSKDRHIGTRAGIKISKNKVTGQRRNCALTIYNDYGIDDVGDNIDFLVEEGVFNLPKGKRIINAGLFGAMTREKLIGHIESNNEEAALAKMVADTYTAIEESIKPNRKRKYGA